ncbi:MAG TPA: c-type cytochrome [Burkholderiales bacterium]|nr:c-type cytochrome [Burkholderiales bacterium]
MKAWLAGALLLSIAPAGFAQPFAEKAKVCFGCHGEKGTSQQPGTPSLGGQTSFFVIAQLFLMRDGRRTKRPTPMDPFAKGLSDDELRAYGDLFAKQPPPAPPGGTVDAARYAKGRALAGQHNCGSCHNPDYSGQQQTPRVANQREDYLLQAMRDYKQGQRVGYGRPAMVEVVVPLADADLAALAYYLAHFRPKP